jgi:myo-inositol 2-dehydrogenase/D-chiro-inositol 1-dehydrogenase
MTVAVGIIGTGIMGSDHAATLQRSVSGAHLAMVADLDLARAGAVAAEFGGAAVGDPGALIASPEVDAVLVASHDASHPAFVRACVAAGKPVLCEKPLSPSLAESAELIRDIGRDAGLVTLGFMRRFDPGYAGLRAAIRDGAIGAPLMVHAAARTVSSGPGSTTESSISNSAVHDFDIVPWLLGAPVTEVSWQAPGRSTQPDGFQDPQLILLHTADGVLSTVEVFLNAGYGYDIRCEVVGESGVLTLAEPVRLVTDTALARTRPYAADWRPRFADAYRLELQAWIDSLGHGPAGPLATARDGLVASAVAEAAVRSVRSGRWIPVELPAL